MARQFANENVPEPTCVGWWLRRETGPDGSYTWWPYLVRHDKDHYEFLDVMWRDCCPTGYLWTGPIPVPEDKPVPTAPSEDEPSKPRPSDEELGQEVLNEIHAELNGSRNNTVHIHLTLGALTALGAAIRAKLEASA